MYSRAGMHYISCAHIASMACMHVCIKLIMWPTRIFIHTRKFFIPELVSLNVRIMLLFYLLFLFFLEFPKIATHYPQFIPMSSHNYSCYPPL